MKKQTPAPIGSRHTRKEREQIFEELVYASVLAEKKREVLAALEKNPDDPELKRQLGHLQFLWDNIPVGPL